MKIYIIVTSLDTICKSEFAIQRDDSSLEKVNVTRVRTARIGTSHLFPIRDLWI